MRHVGSSDNFIIIHNILCDYTKVHSDREMRNIFKSLIKNGMIEILEDIKSSSNCHETLTFWIDLFPDDCDFIIDLLNDEEDFTSIPEKIDKIKETLRRDCKIYKKM